MKSDIRSNTHAASSILAPAVAVGVLASSPLLFPTASPLFLLVLALSALLFFPPLARQARTFRRWRRARSSRARLVSEATAAAKLPSSSSVVGVVEEVHVYPVKSLRSSSQSSSSQRCVIDGRCAGLLHDRRLMIVRGSVGGRPPRFLTQRQCPALATVSAEVHGNSVRISAEGRGAVDIPVGPEDLARYPRTPAAIWNDVVTVADCGDEAADFIRSVVEGYGGGAADDETDAALAGLSPRVVCSLPHLSARPVDGRYLPEEALLTDDPASLFSVGPAAFVPKTYLNDGFPVLIANRSSLDELNRRIGGSRPPLPMSRFRPNVVVEGPEPFAEDSWRAVMIGDHLFHVVKGCPRCKQACTDQTTGERDSEPLETLATFRKFGGDVYFAVNAVPDVSVKKGSTIGPGDVVRVIRTGDPVFDIGAVAAE